MVAPQPVLGLWGQEAGKSEGMIPSRYPWTPLKLHGWYVSTDHVTSLFCSLLLRTTWPPKEALTNKGNDWHKDLLTEIDQVKRELACPSYREIKTGSWLLEQCFGEKIYSLWCKRDNQNIIFAPIKGYFFFLHFKKSSSLMSRFLTQIRKKMRHIFFLKLN